MESPRVGRQPESLEPSKYKSLFGASLLAPSVVLVGPLELYSLIAHQHLHSVVLVVFASVWCFVGGILLGQVVLQNMFPTKLSGWRQALLGWLQLPRTKRYLAQVNAGEPAVLFSTRAVHRLRTLNRICMVLVSGFLILSAASFITTDFLPALRSNSTGSDLAGVTVIGLAIVSYLSSRLIRLLVRRDAMRRSQQSRKEGN